MILIECEIPCLLSDPLKPPAIDKVDIRVEPKSDAKCSASCGSIDCSLKIMPKYTCPVLTCPVVNINDIDCGDIKLGDLNCPDIKLPDFSCPAQSCGNIIPPTYNCPNYTCREVPACPQCIDVSYTIDKDISQITNIVLKSI